MDCEKQLSGTFHHSLDNSIVQAPRSAAATGIRAVRNAGKMPPISPIKQANATLATTRPTLIVSENTICGLCPTVESTVLTV